MLNSTEDIVKKRWLCKDKLSTALFRHIYPTVQPPLKVHIGAENKVTSVLYNISQWMTFDLRGNELPPG